MRIRANPDGPGGKEIESSVIMTTYDKTIVVTHLCVYTIESYVYQTKPPHVCKYQTDNVDYR